jgi:hypothetical protein
VFLFYIKNWGGGDFNKSSIFLESLLYTKFQDPTLSGTRIVITPKILMVAFLVLLLEIEKYGRWGSLSGMTIIPVIIKICQFIQKINGKTDTCT